MGAKNLRYQLATGLMGEAPIYISPEESQMYVDVFRGTYRRIPEYWNKCEHYLQHMLTPEVEVATKAFTIYHERLLMPSQMHMTYPGLITEPGPFGSPTFSYDNGKFMKGIWGGSLTENIIQNLARIVIRDGWEKSNDYLLPLGGKVVMQVHDELVCLVPEAIVEEAQVKIMDFMTQIPEWCSDKMLYLAVEADYADNYSK